jgi:hypothetical protein
MHSASCLILASNTQNWVWADKRKKWDFNVKCVDKYWNKHRNENNDQSAYCLTSPQSRHLLIRRGDLRGEERWSFFVLMSTDQCLYYWKLLQQIVQLIAYQLRAPLVARILVYTIIFTIANIFTDLFWQKLAREVAGNFLPHVLFWACVLQSLRGFFYCFWDWECN